MVERAQKRKREEEAEGSDHSAVGPELPREGMKETSKKAKKQKKGTESHDVHSTRTSNDDGESRGTEAVRNELQKQRQAEKLATKKERTKARKLEARKERKRSRRERKERLRLQKAPKTSSSTLDTQEKLGEDDDSQEEDDEDPTEDAGDDQEVSLEDKIDLVNDTMEYNEVSSTATPSPAPESPAFDGPNLHSGSSSISSIIPPTSKPDTPKEEHGGSPKLKIPTTDQEELKRRLQHRIDELRAARNADGLDGKPARNRQELIEARRRKEEQKKAKKKEMRQKAKEEEQSKIDDELARRFSPASGSLLGSPRSPISESVNNFSFGRIAFADGQQADPSLSSLAGQRKRKGPQDALGALQVAQSKEARLAGYDDSKRADIEQKDMWLNAKKRAHGERVRDDTSLLRKALKRKEGVKRKSEKEWNERIEGVQKGKEMRQNKREENLRKRKEEKGSKGKKKPKAKKAKSRPGFEGSFKARSGPKK
jgi:hypothetical protein